MTDLLDALHYMFEDDLAPSSGEQQEAREKVRASIYTRLYGRETYDWGRSDKSTAGDPARLDPEIPAEVSANGQAVKLTHKEYIPPTQFNPDAAKPFGDVLDAPLG